MVQKRDAKNKAPQRNAAFKKMEKDLKKCKDQLSAEKFKESKYLQELKEDENEISNLRYLVECGSKRLAEGEQRNQRLSNENREMSEDFENLKRQKAVTEKMANQNRQRCSDLANEQLQEEIRKNGGPRPWQVCELCLNKFSVEVARVPRMLICGHTLCLECCLSLDTKEYKPNANVKGNIECPICLKRTLLLAPATEVLVKNFRVLGMADD